jgi:hypothetical protein
MCSVSGGTIRVGVQRKPGILRVRVGTLDWLSKWSERAVLAASMCHGAYAETRLADRLGIRVRLKKDWTVAARRAWLLVGRKVVNATRSERGGETQPQQADVKGGRPKQTSGGPSRSAVAARRARLRWRAEAFQRARLARDVGTMKRWVWRWRRRQKHRGTVAPRACGLQQASSRHRMWVVRANGHVNNTVWRGAGCRWCQLGVNAG